MGFSPVAVDAMTPWQFLAALEGWRRAHGGGASGGGDLSEMDLAAMGVKGFC